MFESEILQLESEIRRHVAMASITGGVIRADHLSAARTLLQVQKKIEGELQCQELRSEKISALHRLLSRVKKTERLPAEKSRGN